MGVYIKGMKMPKNCHECVFGKYEVCAINISVEKKDTITHSCPLVEVPAHGRLIDADALLNLLNKCMFPSDMVTTTAVSMGINWIKEAPTVIEAEEEENMNLYNKVCNQKIKDGCESICWTCIHLKVCFAKDNQPCIECDQYKQA